MYKIMLCVSKKDDSKSLYQFLTTTTGATTTIVEFSTKEELDTYVEKMLNNDGYSKADFIIVKTVDYSIDAKGYSDETVDIPEPEPIEPEPNPNEEVTE